MKKFMFTMLIASTTIPLAPCNNSGQPIKIHPKEDTTNSNTWVDPYPVSTRIRNIQLDAYACLYHLNQTHACEECPIISDKDDKTKAAKQKHMEFVQNNQPAYAPSRALRASMDYLRSFKTEASYNDINDFTATKDGDLDKKQHPLAPSRLLRASMDNIRKITSQNYQRRAKKNKDITKSKKAPCATIKIISKKSPQTFIGRWMTYLRSYKYDENKGIDFSNIFKN